MSSNIDAPRVRRRALSKALHTDFCFPTITPTLCSASSSSISDSPSWGSRSRERIDSVHGPDDIEMSDIYASRSVSCDYRSDDSMESVTTASSAEEKDFAQSAKAKFGSAESTARRNREAISGFPTGQLCAACKEIPLHECLPVTALERHEVPGVVHQSRVALVFHKSLSKILDNRGTCSLCKLLARSVEQPEYDLLKAGHVRDHLPDDPRFRNMASFVESTKKNGNWNRECMGEEEIWPFGYAIDRQQTANTTLLEAKRLFEAAENRDVNKTSWNDAEDTCETSVDDASYTLCAAQGRSNTRNFDSTKSVRSEKASSIQSRKRKRLPCIFMLRVYRRDEEKAGALSVRVYGHGGAPMAPLKEICHFSLRFERDGDLRREGEPRRSEEQIWYRRRLGDYIDLRFFKHCITACESMHSQEGGCSQLLCESPPPSTLDESATIRLIDVRRMSVRLLPFGDFTRSHNPLKYVTLSHRWGSPPLRTGWLQKDNPNPHVPHSERIYYEHMDTGEQSWDPPGATKLTTFNEAFLSTDDSLDHPNIFIPNTITDAMEVVARLGQRYLWVDQLCTVQSGNDEDKAANIERMGQIYNHALFTIVAADSSHADAGLKGVAIRRNVGDQVFEDDIIKNARMALPVNMKMSFEQWEEEAWCFQEKLLSRRLLVFAGGYAVWHCRGGVWREDVNALDGDRTSISFPWPRLTSEPQHGKTVIAQAGLKLRIIDESVRLTRLPAMKQYIECVEEFSKRTIGSGWDILNAFKGLSNIVAARNHLDSPFRQGLPSYFFDVALLWQPKEPIKRRQVGFDKEKNILHCAPPSWSWAGWQSSAAHTSSGTKGAAVHYDVPFDVEAESTALRTGIVHRTCKNKLGEERIRPRKGMFYCLNDERTSLDELGMFSALGMQTMGFKDWDSWKAEIAVKPDLGDVLPLLDERHLVLQTELTEILIGDDCWRTKAIRKTEGGEHCSVSFESSDPRLISKESVCDDSLSDFSTTMDVSHEYWIDIPAQNTKKADAKDKKNTQPLHSKVGVLKLDSGLHPGSLKTVKAVILSEAQYLGNEATPDVLGYPLYNIMLVRRLCKVKEHSFAERIGIGRIYKYAWRAAKPVKKVIVLG